jgi:hypothetical protein
MIFNLVNLKLNLPRCSAFIAATSIEIVVFIP